MKKYKSSPYLQITFSKILISIFLQIPIVSNKTSLQQTQLLARNTERINIQQNPTNIPKKTITAPNNSRHTYQVSRLVTNSMLTLPHNPGLMMSYHMIKTQYWPHTFNYQQFCPSSTSLASPQLAALVESMRIQSEDRRKELGE